MPYKTDNQENQNKNQNVLKNGGWDGKKEFLITTDSFLEQMIKSTAKHPFLGSYAI